MMYLNERLSQHEVSNVLNDDDIALEQDGPAIGSISHVSTVETDNFTCARSLKAGRTRLIDGLSQFPITALWLLKHYEHVNDSQESDTEVGTVSESNAALVTIKSAYLNFKATKTQQQHLQESLKQFPFAFEELVELTDLLVHAFNDRQLDASTLKADDKKQRDMINRRLDSRRQRHYAKLRATFNALIEEESETFLFLQAKEHHRLLPGIILAEQLWLKSRQTLVAANSRLVLFIANQYKSNFLDFDDLVQEGQTGLLKAVDRFNPDLGFQFSTYSSYWIRKAISRALSRCERVVRIPCGQMAIINRVYRAKDELTLKTGAEPSMAMLAAHLNMSEQDINTILTISQTAMSLEGAEDDEDSSAPIDFLPQQTFSHAFVEIAQKDLNGLLDRAIEQLNPREAKVISCHFGVETDMEMTLQEIGTELNLTRERVRQIQVMALGKMRRHYGEQLASFL